MSESIICHFCGEPITKLNGRVPDSLVNHHITYIPELKVPTHRGCHTKYHNTHPNHPTNPEVEYREKLIKGCGEILLCHFCNDPITKTNGIEAESLLIHSLDGNHGNWDPVNKVPTHRGCHIRWHMEGDSNPAKRPEVRAMISKALGKGGGIKRGWKGRRERHGPSGGNDKSWDTRRKLYGLSGYKDPEALTLVMWTLRRERYGSSGVRDPEARREKLRKIGKENAQERWRIRRERYGPSGVKDPKANNKAISKGRRRGKNTWKKRKELYGPSGVKDPEARGKALIGRKFTKEHRRNLSKARLRNIEEKRRTELVRTVS